MLQITNSLEITTKINTKKVIMLTYLLEMFRMFTSGCGSRCWCVGSTVCHSYISESCH